MKQPKPNRKRKYEEEAGKLKLCRDGNLLLQEDRRELEQKILATEKERDEWKKSSEEWRKETQSHQCHQSRWYGEIDDIWAVLVVLIMGIIAGAGFVADKFPIPSVPKETVRYQIPKACMDALIHDKAATDAWREDEREIRKLRRQHENEAH